uniref:Putative secreted protein n=1 Tax=Ixodes ricinus TaxID=34613 RepID=A0A147BDH7_IXORI
MLLLKVTVVVLISEIGSSAKEDENAPVTLPPQSLINDTDSKGCNRQLLPFFDGDEETGIINGGFLTVNCTKSCPEGIKETDVNGNPCLAWWRYLDNSTVTVLVGSCKNGSCNVGDPSECRNITLAGNDSEEEEEEAIEEHEEEENNNNNNQYKNMQKKKK